MDDRKEFKMNIRVKQSFKMSQVILNKLSITYKNISSTYIRCYFAKKFNADRHSKSIDENHS